MAPREPLGAPSEQFQPLPRIPEVWSGGFGRTKQALADMGRADACWAWLPPEHGLRGELLLFEGNAVEPTIKLTTPPGEFTSAAADLDARRAYFVLAGSGLVSFSFDELASGQPPRWLLS